jgi:hypothetical protein
MSKSFLNNHPIRGLRNNNPGNLKRTKNAWQGKIPYNESKDQTFEQFVDLKSGVRAMLKDLIHDINKGKNTVHALITEYAPATENNTKAYIKSVCDTLGIQPLDKLTKINSAFMLQLVRSILKVELGSSHVDVTDNDILEAIENLGKVSTPTLEVVTDFSPLKKLIPAIAFVVFFFYSIITITI